jgi:hypothetical protein
MKSIKTIEGHQVLMDDEHYPELSRYKWCTEDKKHVHRIVFLGKGWYREYLNELILPPGTGNGVLHIDGNPFNCLRANLREVSKQELKKLAAREYYRNRRKRILEQGSNIPALN